METSRITSPGRGGGRWDNFTPGRPKRTISLDEKNGNKKMYASVSRRPTIRPTTKSDAASVDGLLNYYDILGEMQLSTQPPSSR